MAHVITEPCLGTCDTACVEVCPMDCIHGPIDMSVEDVQGATALTLSNIMLYIDPDECIDCGVCVSQCPVEAIFLDDECPDAWLRYIDLNASRFARPAAAAQGSSGAEVALFSSS